MSSHKGFCSYRVSNRCSLRVCDLVPLQYIYIFFYFNTNSNCVFLFFYRFAFIDVDDNLKALEIVSRIMGRRLIRVMLAEEGRECSQFPNFEGCEHCGTFLLERRLKRFYNRHPGHP